MKKETVKVVFLAACSGMLAGCNQSPSAAAPEAEYATLQVSKTSRQLSQSYPATVRGRQDIDIFPQVGGFISEVCVKEGEKVQKGQTLFVIDQLPFKAALNTASASVAAAKAGVGTAQLVYDSKKELLDKKVVSQFDLSTAENSLLVAQAQLALAEAQEIIASNNLSYTVVKSPSEGLVGTLPYRKGALVSASLPRPLTTVSDNSEMYVYFAMTENQLLALARQYGSVDKALQTMPAVQLLLSDGSSYPHDGRVETISGVIDPTTGSVSLRAVFPNRERLLHSGGSGNVVIPQELKDCIAIPQLATIEVQDKVYVYKLTGNVPKRTLVDVKPVSNGTEYIVVSGLAEGDRIISQGVGLIRTLNSQ
jgi:membrane fusion protein (multidrug efflux system)